MESKTEVERASERVSEGTHAYIGSCCWWAEELCSRALDTACITFIFIWGRGRGPIAQVYVYGMQDVVKLQGGAQYGQDHMSVAGWLGCSVG